MNNSMIAKLLAKENITVQYGNYRTAFFDVEKRILGLPKWKDMGKDVHDLMVGHEVGHALYTPAVGWHESTTDIPGIPRSYVNIVEDIRIEKLIQRIYPGLTGCFKRGYKTLDDQDFFGLVANDINPNQAALMDRINLKAKLRDLINIDFSDQEASVVKQAFAVETWDDVIEACRALYEFIGETSDEQEEQDEQDSSENETDSGENMPGQSDDDEIDDGEDTSDIKTMGSGDSDDQSDDDTPEEQSSYNDEAEDEVAPNESAGSGSEMDPFSTLTDDFYRDNSKTLIDVDQSGYQKQIVKAITRRQAEEMIMTYPELAELRKEYELMYEDSFFESFKAFSEETKKFVSVMSKEFEMRKAAYRTLRAQTSRSGSLDLNKLHMYKTSDDIFSRVTQLADAKSHGMVMFIDFSGSMGNIIGDVIRQTLILSEFCKKVGIPFDVYTFTSVDRFDRKLQEGEFDHDDVSIKHVLSSSMAKSTYTEAVHGLYRMTSRGGEYFGRVYDRMGGTPLCETVMASRFIIKDFKTKHNIQKVNVVFLTDGDAQTMNYKRTEENYNNIPTRGVTIDLDGKYIDQNGWNTNDTCIKLLDSLRKDYNVIGYFLAERPYDFKGKVWQASRGYVNTDDINALRKEYNKNKFVSMDNTLGYDKFFIIKAEGKSLATADDVFEVEDGATKGAIAKAFKKHANSKKTNKLFATQFAKMVA